MNPPILRRERHVQIFNLKYRFASSRFWKRGAFKLRLFFAPPAHASPPD